MREWLGAMVTGGDRRVRRDARRATACRPSTRRADPRSAARQPRGDLPVDPAAGRRRGRDRRLLRARRRRAVLGVRALPRGDGRGERPDGRRRRCSTRSCRSCPGLRARSSAGIDVLDVGCGSGRALNLMASGFPAAASRATTSRPGDRARARGGARARPAATCASRCATSRDLELERRLRPRHRLRRDPRPGPTRRGARGHRAGAAPATGSS